MSIRQIFRNPTNRTEDFFQSRIFLFILNERMGTKTDMKASV